MIADTATQEFLMNQMVGMVNAAIPKPRQPCPRCHGTGEFMEPPEDVQQQQIASGNRSFICRRVCVCRFQPRA